jgi:transcriptional regulator with XRE-family HTH domain
MEALGVRVSGVAAAANICDQLQACRTKAGKTAGDVATAAGLDRRTVAAVEAGRGSLASLQAILDTVAPRAYRALAARQNFVFNRHRADADKRFTPALFLAIITDVFGDIDLDPCGHAQSAVTARRTICLPDDGLTADWSGSGLVWINPPFSGCVEWMARACDAWDAGDAKTIVMLTPVRVDSAVFQDRVARMADVLLMRGRMKFADENGDLTYPAPFGLMLSVFGATANQMSELLNRVPSVLVPAR